MGFVGLVEEEWLVTLPTLDISDMVFTDFIQAGRDIAKQLRQQVNGPVSGLLSVNQSILVVLYIKVIIGCLIR